MVACFCSNNAIPDEAVFLPSRVGRSPFLCVPRRLLSSRCAGRRGLLHPSRRLAVCNRMAAHNEGGWCLRRRSLLRTEFLPDHELLLREHATVGRFSIPAFYLRRALRIWPLYFTFLAATIFLIPMILPQDRFSPIYAVSFALFVGNWVCAQLRASFLGCESFVEYFR